MKNWKKTWFDELDSITPKLSDEVKNAPIPVQKDNVVCQGDVAVKSAYNKKALIFAVTAVLLCLAIVGTVLLIPKQPNVNLFTVEINPAVSVVSDKKGIVTDVVAVNADADVILSDGSVKEYMVGKPIDAAVEYYVDRAARLGYIDLDEKGSAVRVSACLGKNADGLLDNVQKKLSVYFASKGVFAVAVTDAVNAQEYCARSGLTETGSLDAIAEILHHTETLTANRNADGMTDEQRKTAYEKIIYKQLNFDVIDSLSKRLDTIDACRQDVQKLYSLNEQIKDHEGNDAWIFNDYWSVKDKTFEDGSLNAIIEEMKTALDEYKEKYGVEITSSLQLSAANDGLQLFKSQIEPWLNLLGDKALEMFSETISVVAEISGIMDNTLAELIVLPKTAEEYVVKTVQALSAAYSQRTEEYKELYGKARETISEKDYGDFVNGIVTEYGSLDEYWQAIGK